MWRALQRAASTIMSTWVHYAWSPPGIAKPLAIECTGANLLTLLLCSTSFAAPTVITVANAASNIGTNSPVSSVKARVAGGRLRQSGRHPHPLGGYGRKDRHGLLGLRLRAHQAWQSKQRGVRFCAIEPVYHCTGRITLHSYGAGALGRAGTCLTDTRGPPTSVPPIAGSQKRRARSRNGAMARISRRRQLRPVARREVALNR